MGGVGIFGLLVGLGAYFLIASGITKLRLAVFVIAYFLHAAASLAYWNISKTNPADAYLYYYDPFQMAEDGLGMSTQLILIVVQTLKSIFGGTFLDYFLLFQAFGFFGIIVLMKIFQEIYDNVQVQQPIYTYLILLMPSMHYWSSAIGKDSIFFCATCVAIWSSLVLHKRLLPLAVALLLMLVIRPHVAVLALAALALTLVTDKSVRPIFRIALSLCAVAGVVYALRTVFSTFGIDLTSAEAIGDRLEAREEIAQTEDAGTTSVNASLPIRLLSLLFRPFFFDSTGALGIMASVENVVVLLIVGTIMLRIRITAALSKKITYVQFATVFSVAAILVFSLSFFNVGLGLRQKWTMIMPGLLVLYVSIKAVMAAQSKLLQKSLATRYRAPVAPQYLQSAPVTPTE